MIDSRSGLDVYRPSKVAESIMRAAGTPPVLDALHGAISAQLGTSNGEFLSEPDSFVLGAEIKLLISDALRERLLEIMSVNVDNNAYKSFLLGLYPDNVVESVAYNPQNEARAFQLADRVLDEMTAHSVDNFVEFAGGIYDYVKRTGYGQAIRTFHNSVDRVTAVIGQIGGTEDSCDQLISYIRGLVEWQPNDPFLWSLWGKIYSCNYQLDSAELVYWEGVRRLPDDYFLKTQLVDTVLDLGRNIEALSLAKKARLQFPDNEYVANILARALIQSGDRRNISSAVLLLKNILRSSDVREPNIGVLAKALAATDAISSVKEIYDFLWDMSISPKDTLVLGLDFERLDKAQRSENFWAAAAKRFPQDQRFEIRLTEAANHPLLFEDYLDFQLRRRLTAPERIADSARLGRISALADYQEFKNECLSELKDILTREPKSEYGQLLAVRYGLIENVATSILAPAARLENAILDQDIVALRKIGRNFTYLRPLCIVAGALLGDRVDTELMDLFSLPEDSVSIKGLIRSKFEISSLARAANDNDPYRRSMLNAVIRINEQAIDGGCWRFAA